MDLQFLGFAFLYKGNDKNSNLYDKYNCNQFIFESILLKLDPPG